MSDRRRQHPAPTARSAVLWLPLLAGGMTACTDPAPPTIASSAQSLVTTSSTSRTPLNGADPRPFYIVAHNPNTPRDVEVSLQAGANALEPDITATTCGGAEVLIDFDSSGPTIGSHCDATRFVDWLDATHNFAIQFPQLALVVFDIKSEAATAAHGAEILDAVRTHLNVGPVHLNVVFSIATRDDGAVFDNMLSQLGEREGAQVDAENDAADIANFFIDRGFTTNIGYGDGTTFQGPNLPRALDKAAFLRATVGLPEAVTYVYTLNQDESMHSFISGGVDGIIPDRFGQPDSVDPSHITQLAGIVSQHPEVRLATRADNPFRPALQSYGVRVTTSDDLFSGTDADIRFTLNGCRGSATIVVDTGDILLLYDSARMRTGNTDWTTIPSVNLGKLSSITIFNDGTGDAPGWKLVDVAVGSARYLGADFGNAVEYRAHLDDFIDGGQTVTLGLTPNFPEPPPTIQCPAPIVVPPTPGQCSAPVSFSPVVDGLCEDVTAESTPASGTSFATGTTTVTSFAQSPSTGESASCTFTVTVTDTTPPVFIPPGDADLMSCDPQLETLPLSPPRVTDDCSGVADLEAFMVIENGVMLASPRKLDIAAARLPGGQHVIQWVATDGAGNQSRINQTVRVGPAIQATDHLELRDRSTVLNSRNLEAAVGSIGAGQSQIGVQARLAEIQSVGPIFLQNFASVTGRATSEGVITMQQGATVGTLQPNTDVNLGNIPWLQAVSGTVFTGADVTVPPDTVRVFTTTSFGRLQVMSRSRAVIPANAVIRELWLEPDSTLVLQGSSVELVIRDRFIDRGSVVALQSGTQGQILVLGDELRLEKPLQGLGLIAPNAHITVTTMASTTRVSALAGKLVEVQPDVRLFCDRAATVPVLP